MMSKSVSLLQYSQMLILSRANFHQIELNYKRYVHPWFETVEEYKALLPVIVEEKRSTEHQG
jgi:hypothetical protein